MPAFVAHPVSLVEDNAAQQLEAGKDGGGLAGSGAQDDSNANAVDKANRGRGAVKAHANALTDSKKWEVLNQTPAEKPIVERDESVAAVEEPKDKESILARFKSGWRSQLTGPEPKVEDKSWADWKGDGWGAWPGSGNGQSWNGEWGQKGESEKEEKTEVITRRLPCSHPRCNFVAHSLTSVSDAFCCKKCEVACDALEPAEHDPCCEGIVIGSAADVAEKPAEKEKEQSPEPAASSGDRREKFAEGGRTLAESVGAAIAERTSRYQEFSAKMNPVDSKLGKQPENSKLGKQPERPRSRRMSRSLSNSRAMKKSTENGHGRPPDGDLESSSGRREGAKGRDGAGRRFGNATFDEKDDDWDRNDSRERRPMRKANAMQGRPGPDREEEKRQWGSARPKARAGRRDEPISGNASSSRSMSPRGRRSRGQINATRDGTASVRQGGRRRADGSNSISERRGDFADRDSGRSHRASERDLREMALRERALKQLENPSGQRPKKRARPRSNNYSEEGSSSSQDGDRPIAFRGTPGKRRRLHDDVPEDVQRARRGEGRRQRESFDDSDVSADCAGQDGDRRVAFRGAAPKAKARGAAPKRAPGPRMGRSGSRSGSPAAKGRSRGAQEPEDHSRRVARRFAPAVAN